MKRLVLICLLILCLVPSGGWAESSDVEWFTGIGEVYNALGEHFSYEIEGDHAVLTRYSVDSGKPQPARVVVPDTLNGRPVTAIDGGAFNNYVLSYDGHKVECLILPEGVTELRAYAFECAHGVKRIELPSTLDKIAPGDLFYHVHAEISFPNGNPFYKVENGFLIDTRTESLLYCNPSAQTLQLPRVRRIEHSALSNYSFYQETLEFPDSVEYIGPYNAYDCVNLKKIIVPGSVIELADHALCINSAEEIILNEGLQKIGADALFETDDLSITVPSTVTWIGYSSDWTPEEWVLPEDDDSKDDLEDAEDSEEDDDSDDSAEEGLIVLNPDVHWETYEEYEQRTA